MTTTPRPHLEDSIGLLPVTSKKGTLVGWAKVDPDDLDRLASTQWRLTSRGYVARCERRNGRRVTVLLAREVLGFSDYGPRIAFVNGDRLDCRRRNLRWSRQWVLRKLEHDELLSNALLRLSRRDEVAG